MKKSRGEKRERGRACRQTFEAAIPPSCNCRSSVSKIVISHLDALECNQFHGLKVVDGYCLKSNHTIMIESQRTSP